MPAARLLTEDEIAAELATVPAWARDGRAISRRFEVEDFRSAVDLVRSITGPADQQNHHPDVEIHWNKVTLRLWTHASGGLTERDFRLARTIDRIADEAGA